MNKQPNTFKRFFKSFCSGKEKNSSKKSQVKYYIHDLSSPVNESLKILDGKENERKQEISNSNSRTESITNTNFYTNETTKRNYLSEEISKRDQKQGNQEEMNDEEFHIQNCDDEIIVKDPTIDRRLKIVKRNPKFFTQKSSGNQYLSQKNILNCEEILDKNSSKGTITMDHEKQLSTVIKQNKVYLGKGTSEKNRRSMSKSLRNDDASYHSTDNINQLNYNCVFPLKRIRSSINLMSSELYNMNDNEDHSSNDCATHGLQKCVGSTSEGEVESNHHYNNIQMGKNLRDNVVRKQRRNGTNETWGDLSCKYLEDSAEYSDDVHSVRMPSSLLHRSQKEVQHGIPIEMVKERIEFSDSEINSNFDADSHTEKNMKIILNDSRGAYNRLLSALGSSKNSSNSRNESFTSDYYGEKLEISKNCFQNSRQITKKHDQNTVNAIRKQLGLEVENSRENDIKMEKFTLLDLNNKVKEVTINMDCKFEDQRNLSTPILKLTGGVDNFKIDKTIVRDYTDSKLYTKMELISIYNTEEEEEETHSPVKSSEEEESINQLIDSTLNELMHKLLKIQSNNRIFKCIENVVKETLIRKYSSNFGDKTAVKEVIRDLIKRADVKEVE
ncbi:putative leucine-rich repeat-containing protein DDB_G0290503 [Centruroides vittatus]|uniref:putative leucine-rich repeat-containing protein DDB_G0290503 n=1 Tax=Centruroides vittatus TaxID=120091 RepID=UPI0035107889